MNTLEFDQEGRKVKLEVPEPVEKQEQVKTCDNCGTNRGKNGMPCLLCGGAINPCDFSHWKPKQPAEPRFSVEEIKEFALHCDRQTFLDWLTVDHPVDGIVAFTERNRK